MNDKDKRTLRELYKRRDELTADDEKVIDELNASYNFGISLNKNCPNCYTDAVIQMAIKAGANKSNQVTPSGNFVFKGVPMLWASKGVVMDENSSDELIEEFIKIPSLAENYERREAKND